jgi:hypothetical protein
MLKLSIGIAMIILGSCCITYNLMKLAEFHAAQ